MSLFSFLKDKCPKCQKSLENNQSNSLLSIVTKHCPDGHFKKEYHPALETVIETVKN